MTEKVKTELNSLIKDLENKFKNGGYITCPECGAEIGEKNGLVLTGIHETHVPGRISHTGVFVQDEIDGEIMTDIICDPPGTVIIQGCDQCINNKKP